VLVVHHPRDAGVVAGLALDHVLDLVQAAGRFALEWIFAARGDADLDDQLTRAVVDAGGVELAWDARELGERAHQRLPVVERRTDRPHAGDQLVLVAAQTAAVHPAGGDDAAEIAGAHLRLDELLGAAFDA
jgi:hypothetical protein